MIQMGLSELTKDLARAGIIGRSVNYNRWI